MRPTPRSLGATSAGGTEDERFGGRPPLASSRGPLLGLQRCVAQALATEAIAEFIRSGGVWEAESNIGLLGLVATLAAADWDALFTVKGINL